MRSDGRGFSRHTREVCDFFARAIVRKPLLVLHAVIGFASPPFLASAQEPPRTARTDSREILLDEVSISPVRTDARSGERLLNAARLFAARKQPVNVLKLWLAHVAFLDAGGEAGGDADMRSVLWWNVAHGGVCPDGLPSDETGAGLWPVALHDYLVANLTPRRSEGRETPSPFESFERGRQMRRVHRDDVLSAEEIASFRFLQGACGARGRAMETAVESDGSGVYTGAKERIKIARAMQIALEKAVATLAPGKVRGQGAVKARIFDLSLFLNDALARAKEKRAGQDRKKVKGEAGEKSGKAAARVQGATAGSPGDDAQSDTETGAVPDAPEDALTHAFYSDAASWNESEWDLLSAGRRLFLYDGARGAGAFGNEVVRRSFLLARLDAAIARRDGADAAAWIARLDAASDASKREAVWKGERGERLVALGPEQGFQERAPLLLHRGIERLGAGDDRAALRLFARALSSADDSTGAEGMRVQARRWVSFTLGTYRVDDEVLAVLRDALPREDSEAVREELAWRAALRADAQGYKRLLAGARARNAAQGRLEAVEPLSRGDAGAFLEAFAHTLEDDPTGATRALDAFLSHVEREDAPVRARLVPLLARLRKRTADAISPSQASRVEGRRAEALAALVRRLDGLLAGVETASGSNAIGGAGEGRTSSQGTAIRSLHPEAALFAGVVRAPPESEVPWPFVAKETRPPSIFTPLALEPVDLREPGQGARVRGWRITE